MSEESNSESSEQDAENFKILSDGIVTDSNEDVAAELDAQDDSELDISDESDLEDDNEEYLDEESDNDSDSDVEDESESNASEEDGDKEEAYSSVKEEDVAMPAPKTKKLPVDPVLNKNSEIEKKIFGDADKYLQDASANFSDKKCSIIMDDLNVLLTFETGQQSITFRELQTLKPGFIFQGNNPVDVPVDVKANGKTIGKGQLIDVGGRIGVQIMELF